MRHLLIIMLVVVCFSCEDVIDVDLNTAEPRLVIEATINREADGETAGSIRLTRTADFFEEINEPVTDAQVRIIDENGNTFEYEHNDLGYYFNDELDIEDDVDYTLEIIDQGQTYRSTEQLIKTVPLFNPEQEEIDGFGEFTQITAFYDDPEGFGDFYLFRYLDEFNREIDIRDDEFSDGNVTPTSFFIEDLNPQMEILLTIEGIDQRAFTFYETLLQQGADAGGGPFDTQPATVRGNVINETDSSRFPLGYFRISEIYRLNYIAD
ncbi:DUF4249 domain-containing protein [Nonlabens ponticola]|uniref:DUF4249 domain-containing protein n=1 Tax=Nonlabens ponticola TaxID=2496866 RepID=A0A3S9N0A6_9FLAO|nr:DUF4249 domain-containing protein [Nonlabens ponticola]AZQ44819.1 DUF4249 domain-containing protein [Nonlabens ponticola]